MNKTAISPELVERAVSGALGKRKEIWDTISKIRGPINSKQWLAAGNLEHNTAKTFNTLDNHIENRMIKSLENAVSSKSMQHADEFKRWETTRNNLWEQTGPVGKGHPDSHNPRARGVSIGNWSGKADPKEYIDRLKSGEYKVNNSIFWHGFADELDKMAAEAVKPVKPTSAKPAAKPANASAKPKATGGKPGEGDPNAGKKIDPVTGMVMFEGVKFNAGLKTEKDETKVMVQTTNPKADLKFKELASTFINKVNIGDEKGKK